jgi:copper chaperone CopZ
MKKAIIQGMCCPGCARDVKTVLSRIFGLSHVEVHLEEGYALFEGFVSKDIIASTLEAEGYHLIDIVKI